MERQPLWFLRPGYLARQIMVWHLQRRIGHSGYRGNRYDLFKIARRCRNTAHLSKFELRLVRFLLSWPVDQTPFEDRPSAGACG